MVTAQLLLGYNLFSFFSGKTLMRDLGAGDAEDLVREKMQKASKMNPFEVVAEMFENAVRDIQTHWFKKETTSRCKDSKLQSKTE